LETDTGRELRGLTIAEPGYRRNGSDAEHACTATPQPRILAAVPRLAPVNTLSRVIGATTGAPVDKLKPPLDGGCLEVSAPFVLYFGLVILLGRSRVGSGGEECQGT